MITKTNELKKLTENAPKDLKIPGKNILASSLSKIQSAKHGKSTHVRGGEHWKDFSKT